MNFIRDVSHATLYLALNFGLALALYAAPTPIDEDAPWPRVRSTNGHTVTLHLPQVERWTSNSFTARAAVEVKPAKSKTDLLGVDPALIERHGAVSPEVAEAMAEGALERFGSDLAVAITGVAGPGGGTEQKPVGYVCWCVKGPNGETLARDTRLPGDRTDIRDRSTTVAMHLLRRVLVGEKATL